MSLEQYFFFWLKAGIKFYSLSKSLYVFPTVSSTFNWKKNIYILNTSMDMGEEKNTAK